MPALSSVETKSTWDAMSALAIIKSGSSESISSQFGSLTVPIICVESLISSPFCSLASLVTPISVPPAQRHTSPSEADTATTLSGMASNVSPRPAASVTVQGRPPALAGGSGPAGAGSDTAGSGPAESAQPAAKQSAIARAIAPQSFFSTVLPRRGGAERQVWPASFQVCRP